MIILDTLILGKNKVKAGPIALIHSIHYAHKQLFRVIITFYAIYISRQYPVISRHFPSFPVNIPSFPVNFPSFPVIFRHSPSLPVNPRLTGNDGSRREMTGFGVGGDLHTHTNIHKTFSNVTGYWPIGSLLNCDVERNL